MSTNNCPICPHLKENLCPLLGLPSLGFFLLSVPEDLATLLMENILPPHLEFLSPSLQVLFFMAREEANKRQRPKTEAFETLKKTGFAVVLESEMGVFE